jgi:hypothetical protein
LIWSQISKHWPDPWGKRNDRWWLERNRLLAWYWWTIFNPWCWPTPIAMRTLFTSLSCSAWQVLTWCGYNPLWYQCMILINEVDQLLTIICGFSILHVLFNCYYISNYKYTPWTTTIVVFFFYFFCHHSLSLVVIFIQFCHVKWKLHSL